jgi:hypothetical protein
MPLVNNREQSWKEKMITPEEAIHEVHTGSRSLMEPWFLEVQYLSGTHVRFRLGHSFVLDSRRPRWNLVPNRSYGRLELKYQGL